jgi:hypothetical protein
MTNFGKVTTVQLGKLRLLRDSRQMNEKVRHMDWLTFGLLFFWRCTIGGRQVGKGSTC